MRLGPIVDRLTNGFVGPTRDIYRDEGVPYLLARHVRDNTLAFDGRTYVDGAFNEKVIENQSLSAAMFCWYRADTSDTAPSFPRNTRAITVTP